MPSILEQCVEKFPERFHSWTSLSQNPNISWEFIRKHPEFKWQMDGLSKNPNITIDIVIANITNNWDFELVITNPGITWKDIINTPDIKWKHKLFMRNPNFTIDIMENNPWVNWDYLLLLYAPNITMDVIMKYLGYRLDTIHKLYRKEFWSCSAVTWEYVLSHPQNVSFNALSMNPNITTEIVQAHLDKPWNWFELTRRGLITLEMTNNVPVVFSSLQLCVNPYVTDIKMLIELGYARDILMNPNITFDYIVHHGKKSEFDDLTKNPFDKHPIVARRKEAIENEIRQQWMGVYGSVIDMLNMRIRDISMGLRGSMI